MHDIKQLIKISKYAGMREDLVQAGGGNSSIKLSPERMLIKASGYQLADLTETDGYAVVNPSVIEKFFKKTSLNKVKKEDERILLDQAYLEGKRPSIETFLHSITGRVTLHTHAVLVDILASSKNGMEILRKLFPKALFVSYATPGIELAVEYFRSYQRNGEKETDTIFLQNHGLIISAETDTEVIKKTEEVIGKIAEYLHMDYRKYSDSTLLYELLSECGLTENIVYQVQSRKVYHAYESFIENIWKHAVCPDCVVYCGRKFLEIEVGMEEESIRKFIREYGNPVVMLYRGQFYIASSSVKKAKEIESMLAFSAEIAVAGSGQDLSYLTDKEQDFLLNWDAEKYRKNMK